MKTKCCILINPSMINYGLLNDARLFAVYAANGNPKVPTPQPTILTSALHVEMRLWPPLGPLPKKYRPNDANHNSWRAMSARGVVSTFHPQLNIVGYLSWPRLAAQCAFGIYDEWCIDRLIDLRNMGLIQPGAVMPTRHRGPSQLATYGLAQKALNIYVKHIHCWDIAGQFDGKAGHHIPYHVPPLTFDFICALHAPIDRNMIEALIRLPLGKFLIKRGLIDRPAQLVQSNGTANPWSKLDCLRTYYGFELILRRLAMHSWPKQCGCTGPIDSIKKSESWFNGRFRDAPIGNGPDWIRMAHEIPDEVFGDSLSADRGSRDS